MVIAPIIVEPKSQTGEVGIIKSHRRKLKSLPKMAIAAGLGNGRNNSTMINAKTA